MRHSEFLDPFEKLQDFATAWGMPSCVAAAGERGHLGTAAPVSWGSSLPLHRPTCLFQSPKEAAWSLQEFALVALELKCSPGAAVWPRNQITGLGYGSDPVSAG